MAVLAVNGWAPCRSSANGYLIPGVLYNPPSAGSQEQVWVELIGNNLVSQGPIQFVTLTASLYYNAVGSWSMLVPYTDALWNMIQSGDFMVNINWRGLFSFGGKCEQPGYQDSIPGAAGAGTGNGPFIVLSGADYLGLIANRICYPAPASAWSAQTAAATDAVSALHLESAIKHYVNNNIGPGALAARRNTYLNIATDLSRGNIVSYTVKFGTGVDINLLDVIRALIAQSGSAMGVQVTRVPSSHTLTFDVYIPRNLSGKAWFSEQLGNLTAISFYITDPTCTDALVQGSGTNFISRVATAKTAWNVVEQFIDSSSETDVNNLNTTAQQAVATGAAGPSMAATAADIPFLTFGRDYYLGDIVTVEVRPGATYSDVISGVTLTADPSQTPELSVVPTIGNSANATATDQSIIGQLTTRIRALEKKLATKLWRHMTHGLARLPSCPRHQTGNTYSARPV
jgi:ReqiPepy6 Gp37-like protein